MTAERRYRELDVLRGIAIVLMVIYHLAFDLAFFGGWDINVWSGGWKLLARTSATLFLLLVGVCFAISYARTLGSLREPAAFPPVGPTARRPARVMLRSERSERLEAYRRRAGLLSMTVLWKIYPKYLRRGLAIFGWGMGISVATFLVAGDAYVKFGILHLIGVSTLLLPTLANLRTWNIFLGLFLLTLPALHPLPPVHTSLLFPLGLPSPGFQSLDYFPLIPWLGVILLGLAVGQTFYVAHSTWRRKLGTWNVELAAPLALLGRHSLAAYLLHQPLLLSFLLSLRMITIN